MPHQRERGGQPMRLDVLYREVVRQLRAGGIADGPREARRLIAAVAGIAAEAFVMRPEGAVPAAAVAAVRDAAGRRCAGVPIGRIVGHKDFFGRRFALNRATLEPRADSEVLVAAVLETVAAAGLGERPLRLLDIGTGSGCLLVTLLAELANATGVGVDLSPEALSAAKENARRHEVADRAVFTVTDVVDGIDGPFDVILSNPPYIRRGDIDALDAAVKDHDPVLALDGGADGLDIYRRIAKKVRDVVPDGWMFLEIGAGMRDDVCAVFDSAFGQRVDWHVWQDINGHDRCVACRILNGTMHE